MEWERKAGPILFQLREKDREPKPGTERDTLAAEPERDMAMSLCIECWQALSSERTPRLHALVGKGGAMAIKTTEGPIPFTAVLDWARFNRLDRELTDIVVEVVRMLDADRADRIASEMSLQGK